VIQFVEQFQEMPNASCHSIEGRDKYDIEAISSGIRHELVEARPLRFRFVLPRNM
jgi:hypothetical protein